MRVIIISIVLIFTGFNAEAKRNNITWHCGASSELAGNSSQTYSLGQDTFTGKQRIHCYNYRTGEYYSSGLYNIKLEGHLLTGFNSNDIIKIDITSFPTSLPKDFSLKLTSLNIYSEISSGNSLAFYVKATTDDNKNNVLLIVHSPLSIANEVKSFLLKANLIIEESSLPIYEDLIARQ